MTAGRRVLSTVLCLSHALLLSSFAVASLSFLSEPTSVVQIQGSDVELRCSAQPNSSGLSLSWRFRGRPLDPASVPGVELTPSGGVLSLYPLQAVHQGLYQCVAQSDTGAIISRYARVAIADIAEYGETQRRSLVVQEGSSVVIQCPLPPSAPPAVPRVRVRGEWLENSTDNYIVVPSGNLQILSVSPRHGGIYKCGAYNPVTKENRVEGHGTKLTVKPADNPSPARIVYPIVPTTVSAEPSATLVLECVVSGSPMHPAIWLKDGRELAAPARGPREHNNLVLLDLRRSDSGIYQCSVQTEKGTLLSVNYTVNVLEEASVLRGLTDQSVSSGDSARFNCLAKGNPTPGVTWLFNASPIAPSTRLRISGSTLIISRVTLKDEGVYQCLVDNGIGSAQSAGRLTVKSEPQLGSPPDILTEAPPPSIHPIQSDEGDQLFPHEEEEEGLIEGEGLGDPMGQPTERSNDRLTPEAPIITSPPQTHKPDIYDLEWRAGRDWGHPINAYFVKYRKVDDETGVVGTWQTVRVPGSEKTLRLSELEPSSLYEVLMVSRSSAGEGQPAMLTFRTGKEKSPPVSKNPSKAPTVSVPAKAPEDKTTNTHFGVVIHERVPEAPDRPTISMATESSVYVTWIPRANGGSPITAFRVEYRRQGRNAAWVVAADNISPLKLSVEVRSLEPGSTYKFRVIAMNQNGDSPHSATSRPYQVSAASPRFSDRPVAGPHISSTDAVSDTQIMLRWTYTPSSNNNTPIQGFYIYYRPTDSDNDSDYKRDVVEGLKQWHLIGQLQPETSYDIKMQCFNDGGESEYSNVMICETKARQPPGVPSQHPITPPGPFPPDTPTPPGGLLYLIVGCILGVMVLILFAFIAMCLWRNRQQNAMHKYDGYLYQPAEMNGHVLEYATLPVSGRIHGAYGHGGRTPGCHHLHHDVPNGSAGLTYTPGGPPHGHDPTPPHGHDPTLPQHSTGEYKHPVPHRHHHNGGGIYTALPQTDSTDCMSCQNFCNNNRCYTKTNGTFSGGTLPLMQRVAQNQDRGAVLGLEMVPLGQVSPHCRGQDGHLLLRDRSTQPGEHGNQDDQEDHEGRDSSLSQTSCCPQGDHHQHLCPGEVVTDDEPEECVESEGVVVCWESLGLSDLDLKEKPTWISTGSLNMALQGDLIQPTPQEV
ncbi:cell adhesion molecule-related/down-regulated by oncogenes [Esox lucius]|uniref:Cell adhesion associated, oncogene regulated n=1 Tax=Esox lucius TaxID=8010 RepID=A0A3P9AKE8_ESOLU|nr:cell adhesion molecule-related/down-regulated by oncogenes [Esox lucius]